MERKTKAGPKVAEIAGRVVALLEPLSSEDRQKVINASLTLLGEASMGGPGTPAMGAKGSAARGTDGDGKPDPELAGLSAKGAKWMRQSALTEGQIESVFDITSEGGAVIASEVPGKNDKERTHNAYVLQGVCRLLASGEASFDDKAARKLCEGLGCYNKGNHSAYMSDKGNLLTGSKGSGWKLTAPGLKHGAALIRQLTKEE